MIANYIGLLIINDIFHYHLLSLSMIINNVYLNGVKYIYVNYTINYK